MSAPALATDRGRPTVARLALAQVGYALRALWRSRTVLIFTFGLPLVWLVIIGVVAGNETVDAASGVRLMQFVTPIAVAMGTFFGTYPTLATSLSEARETGVLKRLRGTPVPAAAYLVGQVGAAVLLALSSFVLTLVLAAVAYGVEVRAETALALAVTVLVGIASFSALGLAVAMLATTAALAQAISIGTAIVLAFISGLFVVGGELPAVLSNIAGVLPLKPYADALTDQFDPFLTGAGWDLAALAIIAAWGVAGAALAGWAFRRQPVAQRARPHAAAARSAGASSAVASGSAEPVPATRPGAVRADAVSTVSRPSTVRLVFDQALAANRATWRDPGSLLLVVVPVGLYALLLTTQGNVQLPGGMPFATFFAASMITWGAGTAVVLNLPEAVARARDRGVLKRLRGTPLASGHYLAGVTAAGLALSYFVAVLVVTTGWIFFGLRISPIGLLLGVLVILLGTLTLAVCGFLLAALVPNSRAVGAVGLMVLFVLAFVSDIFIVGIEQDWLRFIGAVFPLKHLQGALADVWNPAGVVVDWVDYAVLLIWAVGATALAVRLFRWEPRRG
ncbi:ABC transporter permease [Cryobacterium sp. 1639]|uniref:ABC transporter permease n=1 Tax=Cryobacterium inferilacus TaxID=2866629 RepID=UPI001C729FE1|nr:ABC transporter permease [Cryobacterium sp. 1639]MBX0300387.1 ABC transporter permease [Cryobacterium sp. 1639]